MSSKISLILSTILSTNLSTILSIICRPTIHHERPEYIAAQKEQIRILEDLGVLTLYLVKYSLVMSNLREIFQATVEKWHGELIEFNGESDHVHLLLSLNPKLRLSDFVNNLKTVSSRLIRKDFKDELAEFYWKPVFWSGSYCILTCGGAPLSVIKQYIENQRAIDADV